MNISLKKYMGIIILMLSPFFVQAQILDPVSFSVNDAPQQVKAGEVFTLTVKASIEGKWHLYSINNDPEAGPYPTKFTVSSDQLVVAGNIKESEPLKEYDPNFDAELGFHTKKATFIIPLAFKENGTGDKDVAVDVLYQVCDDKVCLPPKTKTITQGISVSGVAENPYDGSGKINDATAGKSVQQKKSSREKGNLVNASTSGLGGNGFFSFLWLAITAGFAALITPCVYPMIPLTVSYFSKNKKSEGAGVVSSALGFGLTIITVFTTLGVLLSLVLGVAGVNQFAANPWVNLFIALVLIVFAISLLGAFEVRLPYQLTNWLNKKSNESTGVTGIIFMGLTISAVSFACTAPFVSGLLVALTGGAWFYPIIGMAAFSAAFASPFVILALFPAWMESMPQSGSWLNVVKVLLGFIELAAAFKFLSNADLVWDWGIISRTFTIAAWIAIFLLAGLYVLGVFTMHHQQKPKSISPGRLLLSIPLLLFTFYLIPGLLGASLGIWDAWLPPKKATDVSVVYSIYSQRGMANSASEEWSYDYKTSIAEATEQKIPVFIDFTGYTCTNCRAMEANVFPDASVRKNFKKMKLVRLYTDDGTDGPANQKFQFNLTGTVALPTYVIVDSGTGKIISKLVGYTQKEDFKLFLEQGLAKFNQINKAI